MPEHRQFALISPEAQEVEDQGVQHAVGQRILLIQQQSQEDAVSTAVFHLGDFQHGCTGEEGLVVGGMLEEGPPSTVPPTLFSSVGPCTVLFPKGAISGCLLTYST